MAGVTSYWDLVAELWNSESDFILLEEDVLPTEAMIRSMWACTEPWCSGSFGGGYYELICAEGQKPCGEPPGRCGQSDVSPESAARMAACPLRRSGTKVLLTEAWLGCVKFGSIRRQIPSIMARAERYSPNHEWWALDRSLFKVLNDEERLSPCVHAPPMLHLSRT